MKSSRSLKRGVRKNKGGVQIRDRGRQEGVGTEKLL